MLYGRASRICLKVKACYPLHSAALQISATEGICTRSARRRRVSVVSSAATSLWTTIGSSVGQLQGGVDGIGAFLEGAPPPYYLIYLLSAGLGLPCSEDALVAWVGSNISKGVYGGWQGCLWTLSIVYIGVVLSDMITFGIGVLLKLGFLKSLKNSLMRDSKNFEKALSIVQRWSKLIGLIQRFSLGFRGPLCLVCGFTGVSARNFLGGVAAGALLTMPIQLFVGHSLRASPSPYLAALALAAGPNLIGHIIGPLATAAGFWWAGKGAKRDAKGNASTQSSNEPKYL